MPSANVFEFVSSRRYGAPRARLREAQLTMLRMQPHWSFARALPRGSGSVKDVVLIDDSSFCLLLRGGRADAFAAARPPPPPGPAPGAAAAGPPIEAQLQWLTSLNIFDDERARLVAHLRASQALLVVYSVVGRSQRGTLYVRVLDVPSVLAGEAQTRECGSLGVVTVASGGFVEYDDQNSCIWVNDRASLRCWDAQTFEQRFTLGPWGAEASPNIRFTRGLTALMWSRGQGQVRIALYRTSDGQQVALREVEHQPSRGAFVFLELINEFALLKRETSKVAVVDLFGHKGHLVLPGSESWEPELFVFIPSRSLMLARFRSSLEIWRVLRPQTCCRLGVVKQIPDFSIRRFSVDEWLATALVVRQPRRSSTLPRAWQALIDFWQGRRLRPPMRSHLASLLENRSVVELESTIHHGSGPSGAASVQVSGSEDLALLDLLKFGGVRAVIPNVCDGVGGGGVAHVSFDIARGLMVLLGNRGGISAYAVEK